MSLMMKMNRIITITPGSTQMDAPTATRLPAPAIIASDVVRRVRTPGSQWTAAVKSSIPILLDITITQKLPLQAPIIILFFVCNIKFFKFLVNILFFYRT